MLLSTWVEQDVGNMIAHGNGVSEVLAGSPWGHGENGANGYFGYFGGDVGSKQYIAGLSVFPDSE